jgi:23S rRNA (cytosine1962-C5)-methyltransferase
VVCDPPKLAASRASRDQAQKAYAQLAQHATSAVRPGGLLVFCSCSAAVDLNALTRALALGAQRSNTTAVVLERHFQGFDHPVGAAFPEGLYLKALIAEVTHR